MPTPAKTITIPEFVNSHQYDPKGNDDLLMTYAQLNHPDQQDQQPGAFLSLLMAVV